MNSVHCVGCGLLIENRVYEYDVIRTVGSEIAKNVPYFVGSSLSSRNYLRALD